MQRIPQTEHERKEKVLKKIETTMETVRIPMRQLKGYITHARK